MSAAGSIEALVLAHQLAGYATAFVVAPLALLAFAQPGRHRPWGRAYLWLMVPLYLTGLSFTFRLHEAGTSVWARNPAFNFTGFLFVLLGWRSIARFRRRIVDPAPVDRVLRVVLLAGGASMVVLGVLHHFPSFALGVIALAFGVAWLREPVVVGALYVRHQRSMLASYCYVLTVLSLVHVKASTDVKWLWPSLVGVPLVVYATRGAPDRPRVRRVVRATLGVALALAVYIVAFSPPELRRA